MSHTAIWLDRNKARIFKFRDHQLQGILRHQMVAGSNVFEQLVRELTEADALLILGPGVAKHHLFNHLSEHHPVVARTIVGCEYAGDEADGKIAQIAQSRFKIPVPA